MLAGHLRHLIKSVSFEIPEVCATGLKKKNSLNFQFGISKVYLTILSVFIDRKAVR